MLCNESQPYRVPLVQACMLSDKWLSRYELLENFNAAIPHFEHVIDFDSVAPSTGMDPGVRRHGMKANHTGYLWSKHECILISGCRDMDF